MSLFPFFFYSLMNVFSVSKENMAINLNHLNVYAILCRGSFFFKNIDIGDLVESFIAKYFSTCVLQ
jgi:hypothetical protein